MIYDENTKKKLDSILKAFSTYIEKQDYFDILYSKKAGYLWIVVDPPGGAGRSSWTRRRICWTSCSTKSSTM